MRRPFLDGPADLVVEIVSPESVGWDRREKFYENGWQMLWNRAGSGRFLAAAFRGSDQHNISNNDYNDWDPVWIK